jgi:hypothetical protein
MVGSCRLPLGIATLSVRVVSDIRGRAFYPRNGGNQAKFREFSALPPQSARNSPHQDHASGRKYRVNFNAMQVRGVPLISQ